MSARSLLLLLALGAACLRSGDPPAGDGSTTAVATTTAVADTSTADASTSSSSTGEGDGTVGADASSSSGDPDTGSSTAPAPFCGDGTLDPGELCDDGPGNSDAAACKLDCTPQTCGDGHLGPGELCDDGDADDLDECTSQCRPAECGDGFVGPGEACDDGNTVDADACSNACALPDCGDGILQPGEDCDVQAATAACDADCTFAGCGDGVFNPLADELCDDGNDAQTDLCKTDCTLPYCGDGWRQPGEACDDGNNTDGDGCTAKCAKEAVKCQNGAAVVSVNNNNRIALCHHSQFCEQDYEILCPKNWHLCSADEFNARNTGWNHSPTRLVLGAIHCRENGGAGHFGFQHGMATDNPDNCTYSSSRPTCFGPFGCDDKDSYALCCAPLPFCGDGVVDPEEQCDDANLDDGDSCLATCTTRYAEPGAMGCGG